VTSYYVVEEEDSFHADDFGNDDAPPKGLALLSPYVDFDEEPDEFFADDYGNDDAVIQKVPRAPTGLSAALH